MNTSNVNKCSLVQMQSGDCAFTNLHRRYDTAHITNHLMSDDQQLTKGLGVRFLPSLDSKREAHTANKDRAINFKHMPLASK